MNIVTNKSFGSLVVDIYNDKDLFYMSRKQINEALEYKDEKSLARIISRNKDVIREGLKHDIFRVEGNRKIKRTIELFDFKQIFQMLRFSKSPKANLFMDFVSLTMEQLITEKAELKFKNVDDEESYIKEIKNILNQGRTLGLTKKKAAVLIQQAKVESITPDVLILEELQEQLNIETLKKKGRIRERMTYLANTYYNGDYEQAWRCLSDKLRYQVGINMKYIKSTKQAVCIRQKEKGEKVEKLPTYLDLIEKYDIYKEAEKAINDLIKEFNK